MVTIQQGLQEDGLRVSMAKLCRWFEQPRRSVYYKPIKAAPKVREELATPIKALELPGFNGHLLSGVDVPLRTQSD